MFCCMTYFGRGYIVQFGSENCEWYILLRREEFLELQ